MGGRGGAGAEPLGERRVSVSCTPAELRDALGEAVGERGVLSRSHSLWPGEGASLQSSRRAISGGPRWCESGVL